MVSGQGVWQGTLGGKDEIETNYEFEKQVGRAVIG
jgi:hypothetical protein